MRTLPVIAVALSIVAAGVLSTSAQGPRGVPRMAIVCDLTVDTGTGRVATTLGILFPQLEAVKH